MKILFDTFNMLYPVVFAEENAKVSLDVHLGYRDDTVSEWTEMAHAVETRKLNCSFGAPKVGSLWFCSALIHLS